MNQEPDAAAVVTQLNQALGAWGWSQTLDRCETTLRSYDTPDGQRHVAFTSAALTLLIGPAASPLAVRQETGHFESPPQLSAGQAVALAEEGATERAFLRCARGFELLPSPAPTPKPTPSTALAEAQRTRPLQDCLESLGFGPDLAEFVADHAGRRVVSAGLANQLWRTAKQLLGRKRANALWKELGVRAGDLPRGTQAQLYATHLNPLALSEATS